MTSNAAALMDATTDYLVTGFVREIQWLLPSKTYYNITLPIIDICKLFYFYDNVEEELEEYHETQVTVRCSTFQMECFSQTMWIQIDSDDNGDIDLTEWKQGLQKLNVSLTDEEANLIFRVMDRDCSGFVDHDDFCSFFIFKFQSYTIKKLQQQFHQILKSIQPDQYNQFQTWLDMDELNPERDLLPSK
eukprot:96641_1